MQFHGACKRLPAGITVLFETIPALFRHTAGPSAATGLPRRTPLHFYAPKQFQPLINLRLLDARKHLGVVESAIVAQHPEYRAHVLAREIAGLQPLDRRPRRIFLLDEGRHKRRKRLLRRAVKYFDELLGVLEGPESAYSPNVVYGRIQDAPLGFRRLAVRIHLGKSEWAQMRFPE